MTQEDVAARQALALRLHGEGCNCAQSVACAVADIVGADERELFRLMEGFGAGMGGFSETCGAVSGGVAAIGFANSAGIDVKKSKGSTYRAAKRIVDGFREKNGSTLCGELKGLTSEDRRPLRSCDGCIEDAVALTCAVLDDLRTAQPAR